jgi:hypothetical protein
VLRGYLRSRTIGPLPLRRLAAAHAKTVDEVFLKLIGDRLADFPAGKA